MSGENGKMGTDLNVQDMRKAVELMKTTQKFRVFRVTLKNDRYLDRVIPCNKKSDIPLICEDLIRLYGAKRVEVKR